MKFLALQPFVPSGDDFEGSKKLFQALGFTVRWDAGDYISFEKDGCRFILQKFDNRSFAENFMLTVQVDNVDAFWKEINEKDLAGRFGIKISPPAQMPYGKECNVIDLAGVCWHFVE
jgi:hypothetical protein